MKKLILFVVILIGLLAFWFGESRKFFCLPNGNCITVWKTYNNKCYIIPGKYYSLLTPQDNFIKTSNNVDLNLFFTDKLTNTVIYKTGDSLIIANKDKNHFLFMNYNSDPIKFDSLLYIQNAVKKGDLKEDASLVTIFVHDNFALDKNGKHL